jgi:hypothetical protein
MSYLTIIINDKEAVMIRKLSLMTIILVGFAILICPYAKADWQVGNPPFTWPGGFNVGGSIEACINCKGGGPLGGTTANVEFTSREAYLILTNPSRDDKTVVVGLGGSIDATMSTDLGSVPIPETGKFTVCISGPTTVLECTIDGDYFTRCEFEWSDELFAAGVDVNLWGNYALLLYWGILIYPDDEDGKNIIEQYEALTKNGWDANEVRLVTGTVTAYLTGDHAKPGEALAFIATDVDPREISWPNPYNPFFDLSGGELWYAMAISEEQPFAFNAWYSVNAGNTLKINARQGVLKTDYDLQDDPLEVYLPGVYPTDKGGTVDLNANGSFTYVPPDPLPVPEPGETRVLDSFTYYNTDDKSYVSEYPGFVVIELIY